MSTASRHFYTTSHLDRATLEGLVERASHHRDQRRAGKPPGGTLSGKTLVAIFFDPSLRTRTSFQIGMAELGGQMVVLEAGGGLWKLEAGEGVVMDGEAAEHVTDAARVLSRYGQALAIRAFPRDENWEVTRTDPILSSFMRSSEVPVINMESALYHPCQAMADLLTLQERLGSLEGRKIVCSWAPHPKPLPTAVPNSFLLAVSRFGADLSLTCPPGYDLDAEILEKVHSQSSTSGGEFRIEHDQHAALEGAEAVHVKSWGSLEAHGNPAAESVLRNPHSDWTVDESKLDGAPDAFVMHCLPVRRGVVLGDDVLDGPRAAVYDQAENRLHAQKAILEWVYETI